MAIAFEINLNDQISSQLSRLRLTLENTQTLLADFGERMIGSITKNFSAGGRPTAWKPSNKKTGKTLIGDTKHLKQVHYEIRGGALVLISNTKYSVTHQLGTEGMGLPGGVIKPDKGKFLAIPLIRAARFEKPRKFENTFVRYSKKHNLCIFQYGRGQKAESVIRSCEICKNTRASVYCNTK